MARVPNDADETALAKPSTTAADRYEKEFMAGEGTVLYRAKARAHWSLAAMVLGIGGVAALGTATVAPIASVAILAFLALTYIMFAVLRVTVSEGALNIQLGLWGPRIPIASIVSAEATTYRFRDFGGWGIRISPSKGTMYNMPGDGGHALKVVWRTEEGREKTTWVGTREARQLIDAIDRARGKALVASEAPGALPASAPTPGS